MRRLRNDRHALCCTRQDRAALRSSPCPRLTRARRPLDGIPDPGAYSSTIQAIFDRSCNASGCHGAANPGAGLDLTSWPKLIAGSRFGEVVVAFRPDESHLIDHLTGAAEPRMPLSRDPLPEREIEAIRRWVADGARNDAGAAPYARSRHKIYVTNQASDQISVIDADAMVVARIIDVGVLAGEVDAPHNVHVDPPGRYWYVTLIRSARLLQFDAATDTLRKMVTVGQSPANPVASPDGRTVYVTNWNPANPTLHVLDAETLTEKYSLRFPDGIGAMPHGLAVSADGGTVYVTCEEGNSVFKIAVGETAEDARLTYIPVAAPGEPEDEIEPYQIVIDPSGRTAYVTCFESGEVRVIDTELEQMIQAIPVGGEPFLEALTPDGRHLYVCNWEESEVNVIDTSTRQVVANVTNAGLESPVFARPHGVAFTADSRYAFVSNENTNGAIPQHHPTQSGGRNGSITVIEVGTNRIVKTLEVEEDPTGVAFAGF